MEIKDNSLRSKNLLIVFAVTAFIDVLIISFNLYQNKVLKGYEIGDYTDDFIDVLDTISITLSITQISCFIALIVLFLRWFRRAYSNLINSGKSMEYTENAAVWGFFIPFVNWVRPIKMVKEIFIKTQESIKIYDESFKIDKNTGFIVGWWLIYLLNGFISNFASKSMNKAYTIDDYIAANNIYIVSDMVDMVAIALAVYLIHKISKLEEIWTTMDKSLSLIDQIGMQAEN